MDKQITNLKGQMRSLKNLIDQNQSQRQANLEKASFAKGKGMVAQSFLSVRKAGRLEKSNLNLTQLYAKMEYVYHRLCKYYETAGILLEDTSDEVQVQKKERAMVYAGHSAFKSAMKIINGDPDKVAMFDQAMETVADDMGNKMGEIERFLQVSSGFMDSVDLENGIFEEKRHQLSFGQSGDAPTHGGAGPS
jgi:hypothetical protein